jgi:anti-sigma B factor antagonist
MRADEQLRIATRWGPDRLILELDGELDITSSALLQQTLAEANREPGSHTVVLDLRGLTFLDSTGLKAIFSARKEVRERGQQFAVTPGSEQVQRLLSLTRLDEHLRTIDSPDALLA